MLGLASSAQVSGDTKEIFPNVVPVVRPDAGVEPLGEDGGRNTHRLKVIAPLLYADLMNAADAARERSAVLATDRAMNLAAAAPLRAAGGPWQIMMSGRALEPVEWEALRSRYSELVGTYGAMRPGFMTGDRVGQFGARIRTNTARSSAGGRSRSHASNAWPTSTGSGNECSRPLPVTLRHPLAQSMSSSLRREASPARRPSRTRIITSARSRAPSAVATSHAPTKAAT